MIASPRRSAPGCGSDRRSVRRPNRKRAHMLEYGSKLSVTCVLIARIACNTSSSLRPPSVWLTTDMIIQRKPKSRVDHSYDTLSAALRSLGRRAESPLRKGRNTCAKNENTEALDRARLDRG